MMTKSEGEELLNNIRRRAEDAEALFSNAGQSLQERTVVAGLLNVLGVDFREEDIVKSGPEPIDVWFREARFQVTEILDQDRPRNLEIKQRSTRVKNAKCLHDLFESGEIHSNKIAPPELMALVIDRCKSKSKHYAGNCSNVDLLIYINLQRRHLYPFGPFSEGTALASLGWRSVSVIMETFAA